MSAAPNGIIARLGLVCYWMGMGIAGLILVGGLAGYANSELRQPVDQWVVLGAIFGAAGLSWLAGRAVKFILAGS